MGKFLLGEFMVWLSPLDDTLVPLRQAETRPDLLEWIEPLKAMAAVWLVSNNVNSYRINRIASFLDVPYLSSARKPSRRKLRQAVNAMDLPVEQVAMVGDRLFTDVLAGNRVGMFTILVDPMPSTLEPNASQGPLRFLETAISKSLGVNLLGQTSDEL